MAQAVAGVARTRFSGDAAPCVQVPAIELRSSLNRPSYVPPIAGTAIFNRESWSVTVALIGWPPWSMLDIRACHVWSAALESCITIRNAGRAIDLHVRRSQIRIIDHQGQVVTGSDESIPPGRRLLGSSRTGRRCGL